MTAHAKVHQAHLDEWTVRIADQTSSGLTAREWCRQNNISIHKYNYWKHQLKESLTDKVLPDIVPITAADIAPNASCDLYNSRDSRNSCYLPTQLATLNTISITIRDIRIELSSADIPFLPDIIKAVLHA